MGKQKTLNLNNLHMERLLDIKTSRTSWNDVIGILLDAYDEKKIRESIEVNE